MNAYTVIYISPTTGLINLDEVEADNAMAAFTAVAKTFRNEPKEFVAVVEGHNLEGETLHFPGDSVVSDETVLSQPEVFV